MLMANVGTNLPDVHPSAEFELHSLVKLQSTGKANVKIPCAGLGCVQVMTTNLVMSYARPTKYYQSQLVVAYALQMDVVVPLSNCSHTACHELA